MSCYFHLTKNILAEAGIEVNPGNNKEIDQAIHRIVGVIYKDCPITWKNLKQGIISDDEKHQYLVQKLGHTI